MVSGAKTLTENDPHSVLAAASTATPALFAHAASGGRWVKARHLIYTSRAIMESVDGQGPPILIVEMPVRHGKSELISHYLPAYYLGRFPERHIVLASSTDLLAQRYGRKSRDCYARFAAPSFYRRGVDPSHKGTKEWSTVEGGGMTTAGIGGDIMGRSISLGVIDDFLRSSSDAMSELVRDRQWEWFESTFMTRLEPGAVVIVMATRWHRDDLIGRITGESDRYSGEFRIPFRRIRFPAIAEEEDELGRQPGDALWPQRWPLGESESEMSTNAWGEKVVGLKMRRHSMEPYWWNAIYQQRPTRDGQYYFSESYFDSIWSDLTELPKSRQAACVAVDLAAGLKAGDYAAIAATVVSDGKIYVDSLIERASAEVTIRKALLLAKQHNINYVVVESTQFGALLATEIERAMTEFYMPGVEIELIYNVVKKNIRIQRLGAYLLAGTIKLVRSPSNHIMLQQLRDFPAGARGHDDGPDALEMAIRFLPDSITKNHGLQATLTVEA